MHHNRLMNPLFHSCAQMPEQVSNNELQAANKDANPSEKTQEKGKDLSPTPAYQEVIIRILSGREV